jgi:hypothetical protein
MAPDGLSIAYAACHGPEASPSCSIRVMSLDARLDPSGAARVIASQGLSSHGLCWTRDGRTIVYSAAAVLWRVGVDGATQPERLELAGAAVAPATAGSRDRLAFARLTGDADVYRFEPGGTPRPLVHSTLLERLPSLSPDGRRIAYQAGDQRGFDIWLADADGSNATRLSRGPEPLKGSPAWSPDGLWVAYDVRGDDAQRDVWTIGVDGSRQRRVTLSPANDIGPSWSRDGRFIYFSSDRTGRFEAYRVPVGGGPEEPVTRHGGVFAVESADGRELYYQRNQDGALMARPVAGGDEREVRPCVVSQAWGVARHGLVYQPCKGPDEAYQPGLALRTWDARSGADRPWTRVDADSIVGLCVSPDGRSVLYGRIRELSSLMLIEGFR